MMTVEKEHDLISQVRGGDQVAFAELFDAHHRRVVHIAIQLVREEEMALDVAQEVFIRAYQELGDWRGEARLGSWLYRTTVLVCFEHLRQEQKQSRLRGRAKRPGEEVSPEYIVAQNERAELVRRAISGLPPRQRAIVILKQFKSLRFSEIAELLGITEGGAKANYHRALLSLRQNMRGVVAEVA